MAQSSGIDPASMVAVLGFRGCIPRRPVNEQTVRWAIHASELILKHDVRPSIKQNIKDCTAYGLQWLDNTDRDTSQAVLDYLSGFIEQAVDTYFTTCHPEIHMVEKVSRAALKAAKLADLGQSNLSDLYPMLFEYMDVMLINNISRPVKDDGRVFWAKVTQAIILDKDTREKLPLNYIPLCNHHGWDEACTPSPDEACRIISWLRRTYYIIGWEVNDIEWQIVNYSSFYEIPCGPRMSIRTGRWRQFVIHILATRKRISKMLRINHRTVPGPRVTEIAPYAHRVLDLVENKWFTSLVSWANYKISDTAVSLHETWDVEDNYTKHRCDKIRQVPLFDHSQLIITEPLMLSRPFGYGTKNKSLKQLMGDEEYPGEASGNLN